MVKLYHEWKCREAIDFDLSVPVGIITALTNNIDVTITHNSTTIDVPFQNLESFSITA